MASLSLTNNEVFEALGHLLAIQRDPQRWDPTTAADVNRIIRSGRRRFFSAHNWSFLNNSLDILTVVPFDAQTITIVNGVVTKTAGTPWPTLITDYVLLPEDNGAYSIASRDSDTQITLHDTSVNVAAGSSYAAYKTTYSLPDNFGGWEGPVTRDNDIKIKEARNFQEYLVRSIAGHRRPRTGAPELYTVVSEIVGVNDAEAGVPTYVLRLFPLPDRVYVLSTRYKVAPGDTLDLANDVPTTHPVFAEAMLESILSAAEVIAFDAPGVHTQRYQELIEEAKTVDNRMAGIRFGRPRNFLRPYRDRYRELIDAPVIIEE